MSKKKRKKKKEMVEKKKDRRLLLLLLPFIVLILVLCFKLVNGPKVNKQETKPKKWTKAKVQYRVNEQIQYVKKSLKIIDHVSKEFPEFAQKHKRKIQTLKDFVNAKTGLRPYAFSGDGLFVHMVREKGSGFAFAISENYSNYSLELIALHSLHEVTHVIDYQDFAISNHFLSVVDAVVYLNGDEKVCKKFLHFTEDRAYTVGLEFFCLSRQLGYFKSPKSNDDREVIEVIKERVKIYLKRNKKHDEWKKFIDQGVKASINATKHFQTKRGKITF